MPILSNACFTELAVFNGSIDNTSKSGFFLNLCFNLLGIYLEYREIANPPKNTTFSFIKVFLITS